MEPGTTHPSTFPPKGINVLMKWILVGNLVSLPSSLSVIQLLRCTRPLKHKSLNLGVPAKRGTDVRSMQMEAVARAAKATVEGIFAFVETKVPQEAPSSRMRTTNLWVGEFAPGRMNLTKN